MTTYQGNDEDLGVVDHDPLAFENTAEAGSVGQAGRGTVVGSLRRGLAGVS